MASTAADDRVAAALSETRTARGLEETKFTFGRDAAGRNRREHIQAAHDGLSDVSVMSEQPHGKCRRHTDEDCHKDQKDFGGGSDASCIGWAGGYGSVSTRSGKCFVANLSGWCARLKDVGALGGVPPDNQGIEHFGFRS